MATLFVAFLVCLVLAGAVRANASSKPRLFSALTRARGGGSIKATAAPSSSASTAGPLQSLFATIYNARQHLAAAAVARSVSILGMYPVDTIKTRIQLDQAAPFRLAGIYGGVGGSLLGQVPYGVLTFGSYEIYKTALQKRFPNLQPTLVYALSAMLGDLTGSFWLCPSEVLKQQLQAGLFKNSREALSTIWKTKGIGGFYQGYLGGLSRDIPFRVAQLTTYEATKSLYLRVKQRNLTKKQFQSPNRSYGRGESVVIVELSPAEAALCGAIAGTFSAFVTCPLDRIKTLLMVDGAVNGGSVLGCAARILSEEGPAGFMTGIVPRVLYIAPSVTLFFIVYEKVQQQFKHW